MTTHALQVTPQSAAQQTGLRPIDLRRDLVAVATLIGEAFADELDQSGLNALREMRTLGHLGSFTGLLSRVSQDFQDMLSGFVWEEKGSIVGNVTIQRIDTYGQRWAIANVAVAPPYRGRGLARKLMSAALENIVTRHGKWAVLQVRRNNQIAYGLYERMGFESLGGISEYRLDRVPGVLEPVTQPVPGLRPMKREEWYATYELAVTTTPKLMQWWQALRADGFHLYLERRAREYFLRLVGHSRVIRLVVPSRDNPKLLDAFLVVQVARWSGAHTLQLFVDPQRQGELEMPLLHVALDLLRHYPVLPINISFQAGHEETEAALQRFGFYELKTLLTMRTRL